MKRNSRFGIIVGKRAFIYTIVLFFFFPPMSINYLINRGNVIGQALSMSYNGAQLLFSLMGCLIWFVSRRREHSKVFLLLIAHMLLMFIASIGNRSITIDVMQRWFREFGFCFLCAEMIRVSQKDFLKAGLFVSGLYFAWGILTIYAFPRGLNHAATTYDAVYGLGAKNNSFPFLFAFFFFCFVCAVTKGKKLTLRIPVLTVIAMIAGIICESMNTTMCLMLVLLLYILTTYSKPVFARFKPSVFFIAFVVLIVTIYFGTRMKFIQVILSALNRSLTFSGRAALWEKAINDALQNPLWGAGYYSEYTLLGGTVAGHAHSQWLDKLSKYGFLQAIPLYIMLYTVFARLDKASNPDIGNVLAFLLLIYLLHMSFDTYNYNFFTMFVIVINRITNSSLMQEIKAPRIRAIRLHKRNAF